MSNPKNKGSQLQSACGAEVSAAHFNRNVARQLLRKTLGLSEADKAKRVFAAREALTAALLATPEGTKLLMSVEAAVMAADAVEALDPTALDANQFALAVQESVMATL